MYSIKKNEPEGWEKAFLVFFAGRKVATFSFHDSALYYMREHFAENQ